jgi:glycosyltransferase involved in cell wall biosynthesis
LIEKEFEVFLGIYNAEEWIPNLIDSLEGQTAAPFSVTIVDNCSTDQSLYQLREKTTGKTLKNEYRVLKNPRNLGAMGSLVFTASHLQSPWVISLHQDDFYHPNHIEVLLNEISKATDTTGLIFTSMQRINQLGVEILNPPTLSQKVNRISRVDNFLLALQVNPINFPACAIRRTFLTQEMTNLHYTAFNDTELVLRILAVADATYLPIDTMHYRIHPLNAASTTNRLAHEFAVAYGLNSVTHSKEFDSLVKQIVADAKIEEFFLALNRCLIIWLEDPGIRNFAKGMLAEKLIRIFGYECGPALDFLASFLDENSLNSEVKVAKNLGAGGIQESLDLGPPATNEASWAPSNRPVESAKNPLVRIWNQLPLQTRERAVALILKLPCLRSSKRPFIQAWKLSETARKKSHPRN